MASYDYLIVGGGMTADAAARGIRERDPKGTIGIIGADPHPPYNRPPLTKGLWKGEAPDSIWRKTDEAGVELHLGRRARTVDAASRQVGDDRGATYEYRRLLLATGGEPRRLPSAPEGIIYFRTLDDYRAARQLADQGAGFAVLGGGFIGAEIAAALRMQGREVTMVVPGQGLGGRVFPAALSRFLVNYYRERGVRMLVGESAERVEGRDGRFVVHAQRTGPVTTVTSHRKPATRTTSHQWPRTAAELARNASRIRRSLNRISCWTNCQLTYFQIATGSRITVAASASGTRSASSSPMTTRQKRSAIRR